MSSLLKRFWKYIEGVNGLILILYLAVVFAANVYLYERFAPYLFVMLALFVAFEFYIVPKLLRMIRKIRISDGSKDGIKPHNPVWVKTLLYLIPLIVFLVYFIAYYPGGFTPDNRKQIIQALTNDYNDWHPVVHTLIAFKLPLTLTGNWFGSIVLFQLLCFSAILGYAFNVILEYVNKLYVYASLILLMLNPLVPYTLMFPHKDNAFAAGAVLLTVYCVRIHFSKGDWLKNNLNLILFVATAAITTLLRHNALLFTVPLALVVLFHTSKKRFIVTCLAVVSLCLIVKFPVYSALNVEKPDKRQVETLGLPMNIISNAVTETPDALDADILEFAYKILPKEKWPEYYSPGCFNTVKYQGNNQIIEEYGTKKVLYMTARCFKESPRASMKSLIKVTGVSYAVADKYIEEAWIVTPRIYPNEYFQEGGVKEIQIVLLSYLLIIMQYLPHITMNLGVLHLILLFAAFSKCRLGVMKEWKKLFFIIPAFAYNFASTLLLTEISDAGRYFIYTYFIVPLLLVIYLKDCKDNEVKDS